MPHTLNLSRAARLVGVTRVALQKKIKDGLLPSFDGMVSAEDLLLVYPDVQFEGNTAGEQVALIKEQAFGRRIFERALPDKEVLAARLAGLSKELAQAQSSLKYYQALAEALDKKLKVWENHPSEELQSAAAALRIWMHQELAQANPHAHLSMLDSYLRIMAAHVTLKPSGHEFFVEGADTLLEAALGSGLALDYGCSNGNCGQCKARVAAGEVMKVRPHDYVLSEAEKLSGQILMCSYTAVSDVVIEAHEAGSSSEIPFQHVTAHVKTIEPLADTLVLNLQTPRNNRLRFLAGQNVVLQLGHALSAEFPIASCPCDDRNLQFHIPNLPGNHFADYVANRLKKGEAVSIEGPKGEFVLDENSGRPLIFIAFDRGFAPIISLMEHAMALDIVESLHLYWIASHETDLYYPNLPRAFADALDNFSYTPLVAGQGLEAASRGQESVLAGLLQNITDHHPDLSGFDIYAAGSETVLEAARKWLLAHGLPEAQWKMGAVRY